MTDITSKIQAAGIVPVVQIDDANDAVPLADALIKSCLPIAQVTFERPDVLIGAGTILNTNQVDLALAAGASFIVSPGTNPDVVKHCQDNRIQTLQAQLRCPLMAISGPFAET